MAEFCPQQATLEGLLLGKLPADARETLGKHLLSCSACVARADTLSASDEFTEAVRARRRLTGDEATVARIIERGKRLRSEIETAGSEATEAFDASWRTAGEAGASEREPADDVLELLAPPEQPDELGRLGGYRILEILGQGGMGVVFRAEDPALRRLVALKVMRPAIAASRTARERFLQEARAAAALDHDHIVHIYQVGEDRRIPFIAMQLLRGESLKTRLEREGRLEPSEVLRIGRETARGLAAAHQRGMIHRDIKPDNLWLEASSGRVKILDFGLVRTAAEDAGLTQSGLLLGTPRYMSPEQAQGHEVDARSDLFSLGSVLYHLAVGKPPFAGKTPSATLLAVTYQDPEPLAVALPQMHGDLAHVITRLLSKDLEYRPHSAEDVILALDAVERQLAEERSPPRAPVAAPASSHAAFHPPRLPRRPVAVALALALIGAMVLAVIAVLRIETPHGVLVVQVAGDRFTTTAQGQTVTIQNIATGERFIVKLDRPEVMRADLEPGGYEFVVESSSGLKTRTKRFTIDAGKRTEVEVWWEPKSPPATRAADQAAAVAWRGWPSDAPPPAIAPLDSEQARRLQEAWAKHLGVPLEFTNRLGMKFRLIPPGEFLMGASPREIEQALSFAGENEFWRTCTKSEGPRHHVVVTKPFYLGACEVTQADFLRMMGKNPSAFCPTGAGRERVADTDTSLLPVDLVTWTEAVEFCSRLNRSENLAPTYAREGRSVVAAPGSGYRLPTEAEWEFACRAGTTTQYWTGDNPEQLAEAAWYGQPAQRTHPVGQLKPNPFGLHDMHGNVYEWVQDWWEASYYGQFQERPAVDPVGPQLTEGYRVLRGGDWSYTASDCRSAYRFAAAPAMRTSWSVGFRVALSVEAVIQRPAESAPIPRPAMFAEAHGLTADALKVWGESLAPGWRPAWIAPRVGATEPLFDTVAVPDPTGADWRLQALSGDTSPAYQEMAPTHRLASTFTYQDSPNANVRLWVADGEVWSYWYGDAAFIEEKLTEARADGSPPTSLSVLESGGVATYEVSLGAYAGLDFAWGLDLEPPELETMVQEYRREGWRPHLINAHLIHAHGGRATPKFLAVFVENPAQFAWDFSPALSEPEYELQLAARKAQGYFPQCVCSWTVDGQAAYAVVWSNEESALASESQ